MTKPKLIKQRVKREGKEYIDLYALWSYEGKTYAVRVRPVFGRDNDKLMSIAELIPDGEMPQKYL